MLTPIASGADFSPPPSVPAQTEVLAGSVRGGVFKKGSGFTQKSFLQNVREGAEMTQGEQGEEIAGIARNRNGIARNRESQNLTADGADLSDVSMASGPSMRGAAEMGEFLGCSCYASRAWSRVTAQTREA